MLKLLFLLLVTTACLAEQQSDRCNLCMDIAKRAKKVGSDGEGATKTKALSGANSYNDNDKETFTTELNCHWDKYYADANTPLLEGTTPLTTCADTGFCPLSNQIVKYKAVDLTNTTTFYGVQCVPPKIVLLHHTVSPTAQATIDTLYRRELSVTYIVGRNGTIYQLVNDWNRAWHAGAGYWREITNVNSFSCGIEIVNSGDEPFNDAQMASVELLVDTLKKRWHIKDDYIIGHHEINPEEKQDPSGYFEWKKVDDYIKIQNGKYDSKLTADQMKTVLIDESTKDIPLLTKVQQGLYKWGFRYLNMTAGVYDTNTKLNIESFNRRYSLEVFIKETIENDTTILKPENHRWYRLSEERLQKLLSQMS